MTQTQPRTSISTSAITLRARERGLLIGGTNTGKSTLGEMLIVDFHHRYPSSRVLILDSKPRFRGEYLASGMSAKRRYRKWSHGSTVPDSVVVNSPDELDVAWSTGARIVIAQGEGGRDVPSLIACARRFLDDSRANRPQLLFVDETMDFFSGNAQPRGGDDILIRVARAGRERGCAALYCSQRTAGIPAQLIEELTKLYLFRLDYGKDVKRLHEMGAPVTIAPPREERVFMYWTKKQYDRVYGPYRLNLARR